jgi:hypothetical protein
MRSVARFLVAGGGVALASLGPSSLVAQPVVMSDLVEAKAVAESVDLKSRTVLLRDEHGDLETIIASPEVRNLAQVHPGDHVLVSVHRSVALEMSKAGSAPVTAVEQTAVRAKPGMRPAAYRGQTVQARVQILNIDLDHRTVSFVGPARILRVVEITDPRLLEFVRTLHEGDEVDITYRLGIAARVVPTQG